jgi:hypothetical protein
MINELIPPDTLTPALQKKLAQLNAALIQLKKLQKNQPPGHLRIAQKGGNRNYFYHYTSSDDFTGKYLRKNEQALAKALAQKDYTRVFKIEKPATTRTMGAGVAGGD